MQGLRAEGEAGGAARQRSRPPALGEDQPWNHPCSRLSQGGRGSPGLWNRTDTDADLGALSGLRRILGLICDMRVPPFRVVVRVRGDDVKHLSAGDGGGHSAAAAPHVDPMHHN